MGWAKLAYPVIRVTLEGTWKINIFDLVEDFLFFYNYKPKYVIFSWTKKEYSWGRLEVLVRLKRTSLYLNFDMVGSQERILTNFRKSKWEVGISPLCTRYGRDDERWWNYNSCDYIYVAHVRLHLISFNVIANFLPFIAGTAYSITSTSSWMKLLLRARRQFL
jgi:hypothetical protein